MVPNIKIKTVKINSKKSEFRKNFYISRILTVENGVSAWAHNSLKIRQHFVRSLAEWQKFSKIFLTIDNFHHKTSF